MPWKRHESRSNPGNFYYFNDYTGETCVEPPPPWVQVRSRRNPAIVYYHNSETGETSVDKPEICEPGPITPPAALAAAAAAASAATTAMPVPSVPLTFAGTQAELNARKNFNPLANCLRGDAAAKVSSSLTRVTFGCVPSSLHEGPESCSSLSVESVSRPFASTHSSSRVPPPISTPDLSTPERSIVASAEKLRDDTPTKILEVSRGKFSRLVPSVEAGCAINGIKSSYVAAGGKFVEAKLPTDTNVSTKRSATTSCGGALAQRVTDLVEIARVEAAGGRCARTPVCKQLQSPVPGTKSTTQPRLTQLSGSSSSSESSGTSSSSSSSDASSSSGRPKPCQQVRMAPRCKKKRPNKRARCAPGPDGALREKKHSSRLQRLDASQASPRNLVDVQAKFWNFLTEAIRGRESTLPACRDYALGGLALLLPDVLQVAQRVIAVHRGDMAETLWRIVVIVWLGCGGPGFRTYRHLVEEDVDLCGLAPTIRLPPFSRDADLEPVYCYLKELHDIHSRKEILSGDGTSVKFRFSEAQQGLPVFKMWHRAVVDVMDCLEASLADARPAATLTASELEARRVENLRRLGSGWLAKELMRTSFLKALSVKEVFCYLGVAYPFILEAGDVPFGPGAVRGFRLVVLGDGCSGSKSSGGGAVDGGVGGGPNDECSARVTAQDLAEGARAFVNGVPAELGAAVRRAAERTIGALPKEIRALPGYQWQLQLPQAVSVLDVEVCFCWFKSYCKSGVSSSWRNFHRSKWPKVGLC
eukprot:TRINITY_DN22336_c0_g3_i1.p1 TRINITY_DN22336_c0_g3~~TRINITY_DN22336_c0_g3_i1.p1  ORF type:complete len:758 (-),score=123.63 TRINITY_DN22336_c0_g3_i1:324-2597(-)